MNLKNDKIYSNDFRLIQRVRITVGFSIIIIIALMHLFRIGSYLEGNLYIFYHSYVSDLIIPFGFYFLICINELYINILRKWYVKAIIIIGLTTLVETMQFYGIYALGITFDTFDILAYIFGVGIAVFIDRYIFRKLIPYWDYDIKKIYCKQ